jgi:hypothetical protein
MSFGSPPRNTTSKKFVDPLIHNAAAARREAALAERNNRRPHNAHLSLDRVNEFGIPIPSDDIQNYVPGLNNHIAYSMNNFKAKDPVMSYAQRQMNKAKATYKNQRRTAINNVNRGEAGQQGRAKRPKTQRKARKTRRKN